MSNLANQLKKQGSSKSTTGSSAPAGIKKTSSRTTGADVAEATAYRPEVRKLSAELPADEFKWVRVTAAERDTNATAIVRGLLLLARKDPKILNAALDSLDS